MTGRKIRFPAGDRQGRKVPQDDRTFLRSLSDTAASRARVCSGTLIRSSTRACLDSTADSSSPCVGIQKPWKMRPAWGCPGFRRRSPCGEGVPCLPSCRECRRSCGQIAPRPVPAGCQPSGPAANTRSEPIPARSSLRREGHPHSWCPCTADKPSLSSMTRNPAGGTGLSSASHDRLSWQCGIPACVVWQRLRDTLKRRMPQVW